LSQFGSGASLKLVTVAGDSQEPELGDGDMVMIDTASTRLRDGMHVVRLDDALLIKRVQLQGSTVLLKSANTAYDDIVVDRSIDRDQFEIIGRAVWASRML
jgi:phage repressor protein C with HTH and peptisase S24 domain